MTIIAHGKQQASVLEITLRQIFEYIIDAKSYTWKLIWLNGISINGEDIISLENKINKSESGKNYKLEDLLLLSDSLLQLLEITIIGSKDINNLVRNSDDYEMQQFCEYVIELIDGAYWEVYSSDIKSIENIKAHLDGVRDISNEL